MTANTASRISPRIATAPPARLHGSLGVGSIVFMVVAAAAPLTTMGGGTPVGILLGNGAGFPALFLVVGGALLLFSVGLSAMSRHIPKAGAFFSYVAFGLNPAAGLAAAMLALVTYTAVQVGVYALLGLQISGLLAALGVDSVPWWLCSLLAVACVALLGYRHIDVSSKVLGVLLIAEIGVVIVLSIAIVAAGGAHGLNLAPFTPAQIFSGNPGVGLMFAAASFIGFESTAVYRDEAKDPKKTIARATYTALIAITVFYAVATWALVMGWGVDDVVTAAANSLTSGNMLQLTGSTYIAEWYGTLITVLPITSLFACVLSFHNVLTRYLHSMSSAGTMPASLSTVHGKHHSPSRASLVQTVSAFVIVATFAIFGLDPYAQAFTWFSGVTTLGFVVLMAFTCFAVLAFFRRNPGTEPSMWKRAVAPAIGLVALLAFTAIVTVNFPLLVGDVDATGTAAPGPLTFFLIGVVVIFPVIGLVQAFVLRRRSPESYRKIVDSIAE